MEEIILIILTSIIVTLIVNWILRIKKDDQ